MVDIKFFFIPLPIHPQFKYRAYLKLVNNTNLQGLKQKNLP